MKSNRQSFLHGAAILMASLVIVKILGFAFKIPLANILGGVGMGYYNTAFMLFSPVYAIATAGFPAAVSKLIAENAELGNFRNVKKIRRVSMLFYMVAGVGGSVLMVVLAELFCRIVGNPNAYWSVVAIAPSILFGCLMAAYRGYYEGLSDMRPTAISQVVEVVVKLIVGLVLAALTVEYATTQFAETGLVFGTAVATEEDAISAAMPFAAAASVFGVTCSDFAGAVYLMIRYKREKGISRQEIQNSPRADRARSLFRQLIAIAFPICIGSIVVNLTSLIDLVSMMNQLKYLIANQSEALMEIYESVIPANMAPADIPNYLYGSYTGLAVSIFSIVPAVTGVLGKSALPMITSSWTRGNRVATQHSIEQVLRISSICVFPAGFGITALAGPLLSLLFSSRPDEVAIATRSLEIMGIGVIFLALSTPLFAIMQSIGRADLPVKHMVIGSVLKLALNIALISIPVLNINGAALATTACYTVIFILEMKALVRHTGMRFRYRDIFIRPLFAAGLSAAGAAVSYQLCTRFLPGKVATVLALGVAVLVYMIALFCLKGITKSDILALPGGKKIQKGLEKLGFML